MRVGRPFILFMILLSCILCGEGEAFSQRKKIKITFANSSPEETEELSGLINKGFKYLSKSYKLTDVKACIDSARLICINEGIETPPLLFLLSAEYNFRSGNFRKASDEGTNAMKRADDSGDYETFAKAMVFMGRYYARTSFYTESLDSYENSISLANKRSIKGILPRAYEGQAKIYNALGDMKNYRVALEKQIESSKLENDSAGLILGYYLLGTYFTGENDMVERRNFRAADSLLTISYNLSVLRKDTISAASSLANMGWNHYLAKMYDPALSYYKKSLNYSLPANIHSAAANSYGNSGNIYRDLGNTERSLQLYKQAIEQARIVNDWYSLGWVYKDMSDMYLRLKDTAQAFNTFVLHKQFNDSLLTGRSNLGLTDARLRYETDTHFKEMELLSLRVKNQRLLIYGFWGLTSLVLLIGWLLFRASKHKTRQRLSELSRKMSEMRQANLRQQMNPHFIFNTLNSIQYYMYQNDKLATNNYLTKFSNLMRKVLDNSQHTSIPLRDELNALKLYLELECIRFKDKFGYEIKVDEEIDTLLYKVPTMLIQPYVENSICHGLMPMEGKGSVKIDIRLDNDHLLCTIEDNGIGREAAQERKDGSINNHNSLGTQIVASRLELVNELYGTTLETLYTDLKDVNGEPAGTLVEIHIPIMT